MVEYIKAKKLDNFELIKPFGPPIGKFVLPKTIISKINDYIDELIKDQKNLMLLMDYLAKSLKKYFFLLN